MKEPMIDEWGELTDRGKKVIKTIIKVVAGLAILATALAIFFNATPIGRKIINKYDNELQEVDEQEYEDKKLVEDTCRSMIASYNADKLTYEQYKNSTSALEKSWGESAKMRANSTASKYNEYVLKNSHVWKENCPSDIFYTLTYLQ